MIMRERSKYFIYVVNCERIKLFKESLLKEYHKFGVFLITSLKL